MSKLLCNQKSHTRPHCSKDKLKIQTWDSEIDRLTSLIKLASNVVFAAGFAHFRVILVNQPSIE